MKISFFLCSEELLASLRKTLKSVKDILHILKKKFNSPSSACTTGDWTAFLKAGSCILTDLAYVYELVIGVIDVSRSKDKGYGTIVKEGFYDELDELRQIYKELPEFLEEVSSLELARLPIMSGAWSYLMCVFEEKLDETTLENLQDFEFAFFYCTLKTRELDNLLGDIYHKILDMERVITGDLVSQILLFSAYLLKALNFSAEHDCFLSLALVARQNNYVRPTLTAEDLLDIQNGREMTVDTFIPNDTKIHDDGRINIITGPNYSGKSIYIKQVALIVFLSHIGSFVPIDAATVGLTNKFDIYIPDGTGLLGGTINHFITCYDPPKVLVCSHLTEMFNDSCIQESDNIKYYTMSVLQPDDGTDIEDIVFLYRLVPGHALLSYGVPEEVIKRAASLLNAIGNNNHVDQLCNDKISAQDWIQLTRCYHLMLVMGISTSSSKISFLLRFMFFRTIHTQAISWFTFIGIANCCEPSKTALTKR
ncbi:unnamed protein product [Camellia sinensis]